jgi:hypothetical protein
MEIKHTHMSHSPFIIKYSQFSVTKLADENKQFHANVRTTDALMRAKEVGLDLVCFNKPEGNELAFCKIIDFNKWKYETEKKKKKEESKGKKEHKEIQLSPNIEDNDIGIKLTSFSQGTIMNNNFIDNKIDTGIVTGRYKLINILLHEGPFFEIKLDGNYWDKWKITIQTIKPL